MSKSGHSGENTASDLKVLSNPGPDVTSYFNESTSSLQMDDNCSGILDLKPHSYQGFYQWVVKPLVA